jgi:hypothetical protein
MSYFYLAHYGFLFVLLAAVVLFAWWSADIDAR